MKISESSQQMVANKVFPEPLALSRRLCPGEGGILYYITHIGMFRPKGYFFRRFGLKTGKDFSHFGLKSGMVFEEEYEHI